MVSHSEYNTPPCTAPQEGEPAQTFINRPDLSPRREQSGRPSRSGEVALAPPHGFKGCLWFGTEVLTCTIEMILVSTVLTFNERLSSFSNASSVELLVALQSECSYISCLCVITAYQYASAIH